MQLKLSTTTVGSLSHLRAYAEYCLFRGVTPHARLVRLATVRIERQRAGAILCSIHLDLGPFGRIKTQGRDTYPIGAIDRAVERLAWLLERRLHASISG